MATQRNRRTISARTSRPPRQSATVAQRIRLTLEYIDINDIVPYEFNARDNREAIQAVRKSIREFGFINPIVLDDDNVLIAGHTRTESAKEEGYTELPFIRASHLTPEQVRMFRLVDNKVAEIAKWDDGLLAMEFDALREQFEFTNFGWDEQELDCLSQLVTDDCLQTAGLAPEPASGEGESRLPVRRAPATARIVIGDFVFYRPAGDVRAYLDGLRRMHDANAEAIEADICERLGLLNLD